MKLELTKNEYRRLLDLVYAGNWVLNSIYDEETRIADFDDVESKVFSYAKAAGFPRHSELDDDGVTVLPSDAYIQGGIQDAIREYEDTVFYEILAEELARRDMNFAPISNANVDELAERIDSYIDEFEENGIRNIGVVK
ncbi:MAG: hypothetical protein LBM98_04985 [Oscillospiraceae bacterium]|jgi:hypothetical protein|nr:hypothetical protein [Oscillospiraceae bacterium]